MPVGLDRSCPAVGAVERRTVQWEVPAAFDIHVESPLILHASVVVLGTTTLVRRLAEVTSSVEGTAPEIDPQPSLPPTGGEDHGKAQGGIVFQSTFSFIIRRRGRRQ